MTRLHPNTASDSLAQSAAAPRHAARRGVPARCAVLLGALAATVLTACSDHAVPYFTAPVSIPTSAAGVAQGITGVLSFSRQDQFDMVEQLSSLGREAANFTNTEPRFITYDLGLLPIPVGEWVTDWENEYQDIRQTQSILATIPQVAPAYTTQQAAGLKGVVQTIEALNYLYVIWAHDSLGLVIMQSPNATSLNPAVCYKDGLRYVVALLDSANSELNTAGSLPLKSVMTLPAGFASVGAIAGPSTVQGSFAAFNRALAAKAGYELAYAIARSKGGASAPSVSSPGSPDVGALTRADSAATASALYNPAALTPNPTGGWVEDAYSVMFDWSASTGDQVNPMNGNVGTQAVLNDVYLNQDTADLRWKAKFALNANLPVQTAYSAPASNYIYNMYPSPSSPTPIVRNETLVLLRAQIQLGLTNYATALTLINDVRTTVGGLTPVAAAGYVATRDALLHEQQISTMMEGGGDRVIALRNYGIAAVADTTWKGTKYASQDVHTTVYPISALEIEARGGSFTFSCSAN